MLGPNGLQAAAGELHLLPCATFCMGHHQCLPVRHKQLGFISGIERVVQASLLVPFTHRMVHTPYSLELQDQWWVAFGSGCELVLH